MTPPENAAPMFDQSESWAQPDTCTACGGPAYHVAYINNRLVCWRCFGKAVKRG